MDNIEIRTSRTIVRAFRKTDAADVFDDVTPVFARFLSRKMTHLPASLAELRQSWLSSIDEGSDLCFVIRLMTDDSYIGIVYLRGIRTPYAEVSIWFREDVYGQGFGKEILSAVAAWATQALEVPFLEFCVDERDVKSRIIAESLAGYIIGRRSSERCSSLVYRLPIDLPRTLIQRAFN